MRSMLPARCSVIGLGEDGIPARAFAMRLALLGIPTVHHFDPVLMSASSVDCGRGDVLLVFSEHGKQPALVPARAAVP